MEQSDAAQGPPILSRQFERAFALIVLDYHLRSRCT
jgi:hypothetical protein